eukprot:jgi/Botrbrau1/2546/Bobra.0079s0033.1
MHSRLWVSVCTHACACLMCVSELGDLSFMLRLHQQLKITLHVVQECECRPGPASLFFRPRGLEVRQLAVQSLARGQTVPVPVALQPKGPFFDA